MSKLFTTALMLLTCSPALAGDFFNPLLVNTGHCNAAPLHFNGRHSTLFGGPRLGDYIGPYGPRPDVENEQANLTLKRAQEILRLAEQAKKNNSSSAKNYGEGTGGQPTVTDTNLTVFLETVTKRLDRIESSSKGPSTEEILERLLPIIERMQERQLETIKELIDSRQVPSKAAGEPHYFEIEVNPNRR